MGTRTSIDQAVHNIMRWSDKPKWMDRKANVFEEHVIPICEEFDLSLDELIARIGDAQSMLIGIAYEDFLTRRYSDKKHTIIDDYLKRKATAGKAIQGRGYLHALGDSRLSLYEVMAVAQGQWVEVRDLLQADQKRIRVYEKSGTQSLTKWDCLAARVINMDSKRIFTGGLMLLQREYIQSLQKHLATAPAQNHPMLVSQAWLRFNLKPPAQKSYVNTQGHDILISKANFRLKNQSSSQRIADLLDDQSDWSRDADNPPEWSWLETDKAPNLPNDQQGLMVAIYKDDKVVMAQVFLEPDRLIVACQSKVFMERCIKTLQLLVGDELAGNPLVVYEDLRQAMANRTKKPKNSLRTENIDQEDKTDMIKTFKDKHYRKVLGEPLPFLDGLVPLKAVKTDEGCLRMIEWLKRLEINEAKAAAEKNIPVYDTEWIWQALGLKNE